MSDFENLIASNTSYVPEIGMSEEELAIKKRQEEEAERKRRWFEEDAPKLREEQNKNLSLLSTEQEQEQEYGMHPGLASTLAGTASMLRTSGWQSQPLSYGQRLGYAIPEAMQAYYQQGAHNQEAEEAERAVKKEQEAQAVKIQERSDFIQYMTKAGIPERKFELFLLKYDQDPDTAIASVVKWHEEQKKMTPEQEEKAFQAFLDDAKTDSNFTTKEVQFLNGMSKEKYPNRLDTIRDMFKKKYGMFWREKDEEALLELEKQKTGHKIDLENKEFGLKVDEFKNTVFMNETDAKLKADEFAHQKLQASIQNQLQGKRFHLDVKELIDENDRFYAQLKQTGKFKESELERQDRIIAIKIKALEHTIKNENDRLVLDQTKHTDNFGLEEEKLTKTFALEEKKLLLSKEKFGWSQEKFDKEHGFAKEKFKKEHEFTKMKFDQTHQISVQRTAAEILKWGQDNDIDNERIKIKLQELHQKNEHHLGDMDYKMMVHHATVQNKAKDLAFRVVQFDNLKDEQKIKHSQWQKKHDQTLKEHVAYVENEARKANAGEKNLKLKEQKVADAREFFYADLEFEKAKIREQKMLQPKKLVGQDALDWAEENNPEVYKAIKDKKNVQVINLDKYGNYDSKDEIESGLLSKSQMDQVYKIQKDYTAIPAIKDANKMASLLVSLKNLAATRKVTDPNKSSGVAEFAMIYKFMKSLDETSTVLASEFRNASQAGRSFFANVGVAFQKQWDGVQLDQSQKQEILNSVKAVAYAKLTEVVTPQYNTKLKLLSMNGGLPDDEARGLLVNPLFDYFENHPEDKIKLKKNIKAEGDDSSEDIHNDTE